MTLHRQVGSRGRGTSGSVTPPTGPNNATPRACRQHERRAALAWRAVRPCEPPPPPRRLCTGASGWGGGRGERLGLRRRSRAQAQRVWFCASVCGGVRASRGPPPHTTRRVGPPPRLRTRHPPHWVPTPPAPPRRASGGGHPRPIGRPSGPQLRRARPLAVHPNKTIKWMIWFFGHQRDATMEAAPARSPSRKRVTQTGGWPTTLVPVEDGGHGRANTWRSHSPSPSNNAEGGYFSVCKHPEAWPRPGQWCSFQRTAAWHDGLVRAPPSARKWKPPPV